MAHDENIVSMLDTIEASYRSLGANWDRQLINRVIAIAKAEDEKSGWPVMDSILEAGLREANSRLLKAGNRFKKVEMVEQCAEQQCNLCKKSCKITNLAIQDSVLFCTECFLPSKDGFCSIRIEVIDELKDLVQQFTRSHTAVDGYPATDFVCVKVFEMLREHEVKADEWPFNPATEKKIFNNSKLVMQLSGEHYMHLYLNIEKHSTVIEKEYNKWMETFENID